MAGKRIALTFTTALVALGVVACGGSNPPSGMPEPDDPMMGLDSWTAAGAPSSALTATEIVREDDRRPGQRARRR